jgi:hypothetical protein
LENYPKLGLSTVHSDYSFVSESRTLYSKKLAHEVLPAHP